MGTSTEGRTSSDWSQLPGTLEEIVDLMGAK